jgi:transcriptional regulator with XRE-family HTH domain
VAARRRASCLSERTFSAILTGGRTFTSSQGGQAEWKSVLDSWGDFPQNTNVWFCPLDFRAHCGYRNSPHSPQARFWRASGRTKEWSGATRTFTRFARCAGVLTMATDRRFIEHLTPDRLRELLEGKGMDPKQLANRLGIHPATVRGWLRGDNRPYRNKLPDILRLFGFPSNGEAQLYGSSTRKDEQRSNDSCESNSVRIADCSLIVIMAVLVVAEWMQTEFISSGSRLTFHPHPWNDGILASLADGNIDIALYNKRRVEEYLRLNPEVDLEILMDFGESMAGRHFYVLGKKKLGLKISTLSEFSAAVRGGTIAVPIKSDMHDTFLDYLASVEVLDDCNISLVHYPTTGGLELLDAAPAALLISGQNVRYQAKFRQDYEEIVSSHLFAPTMLADMKGRARNCVVVNRRLYTRLPKSRLQNLLISVKTRFSSMRNNHSDYRRLVDEMIEHLVGGFSSRSECEYTVSEILRETYGLGHVQL